MHSSTKEEGWAELETSPLSSLGCTATGVAQMKLSMAPTAKISFSLSGIMSALG